MGAGVGIFAGLLGGYTGRQLEDEDRMYKEKLAQNEQKRKIFSELISNPNLSDEARSVALQGIVQMSREKPIAKRGKQQRNPSDDVLDQLMQLPPVSQAGRPPMEIPPVPSTSITGMQESVPGTPPINVSSNITLPQLSTPTQLPGVPSVPGLFRDPLEEARKQGQAKRAQVEGITGKPLSEEEAARAAGLVPKANLYEGRVEADPEHPGQFRTPVINRNADGEDYIVGYRPAIAPRGPTNKTGWISDAESSTGYSMVQIDPAGNQVGITKNLVPPAGLIGKISTTEVAVSQPDGTIVMVPKTTVTKPSISGAIPPVPKAGSSAPGQGQASKGEANPRPGRVVGGKVPSDVTAASRDALQAKNAYDTAVTDAKDKTPRGDLAIVFHTVRSMVAGAGRMTQVEVLMEARAGGYGQRIQRWVQMATEGTLPDDQRAQMLEVIKNAYIGKAKNAAALWKQRGAGSALPPHLAEFDPGEASPNVGQAQPSGAPIKTAKDLKAKYGIQ